MRTKTFLAPIAALALALSLPMIAPQRAEAISPATASWSIDGGHSSVVFRTKHLGVAYFYGTFNEISGELRYDPEKPAESSIEFTVQAESVDSRSEQRDGHLKSSDFFSTAEFPEIRFKSSKVEPGEGDLLKVTGGLELRGVTKEITVDVTKTGEDDTFQGHKAGFETSFEIDMNDFEVPFVRDKAAVGPEVTIYVSIEAVRGER